MRSPHEEEEEEEEEEEGVMEPSAVRGESPAHTPYLLFAGFSNGLHECHLYCHVAPDEVAELVTPDGDVVGRWPSDQVRTSDVHIASGNRLYFDRADLSVRVVGREPVTYSSCLASS